MSTPRVLMIDNYDSFTWNVYQYLCLLGADVTVFRNDQITLQQCIDFNPSHLVVSPGPGHPRDAAISNDTIRYFAGKIPVFGVCLGEQCIYELYGGTVTYAGEIMHGKTSKITHDNQGVFKGIPQDVEVIRYHSLAGDPKTLPNDLVITSQTNLGVVMGVRHKTFAVEGVQFHPESIKSQHGLIMFQNFLNFKGGLWSDNIQKPSILDKIIEQRKIDVEEAKKLISLTTLQEQVKHAPSLIDFEKRLRQFSNPMAIIGEIKRASPSKGDIDLKANAPEQAMSYYEGGVAAISVLTEPHWFKGTLHDLKGVRERLDHLGDLRPALLRKDFIIDLYQVYEARVYGADTVLLIVAALTPESLLELLNLSRQLGMEPLVEVNNQQEMTVAINAGAKIVGVNNRNLHTFHVAMETTTNLASMVPNHIILAALSGITSRQDVETFEKSGAKAVLVGEALMKSNDKHLFISQLLGKKA